MAWSLGRKKTPSSTQERFSDTPPITIYKTTSEVITSPGHPAVAEDPKPSRPRPTSKAGIVLGLLEGPEGATLAKLVEVTDWLPHTARAALTGLRKRGFAIVTDKVEREGSGMVTVYRIKSVETA